MSESGEVENEMSKKRKKFISYENVAAQQQHEPVISHVLERES
jgi:hypothetical protein